MRLAVSLEALHPGRYTAPQGFWGHIYRERAIISEEIYDMTILNDSNAGMAIPISRSALTNSLPRRSVLLNRIYQMPHQYSSQGKEPHMVALSLGPGMSDASVSRDVPKSHILMVG